MEGRAKSAINQLKTIEEKLRQRNQNAELAVDGWDSGFGLLNKVLLPVRSQKQNLQELKDFILMYMGLCQLPSCLCLL